MQKSTQLQYGLVQYLHWLYLSDSTCQSSSNLLTDARCQRRGCWCKFTNNCLQS